MGIMVRLGYACKAVRANSTLILGCPSDTQSKCQHPLLNDRKAITPEDVLSTRAQTRG